MYATIRLLGHSIEYVDRVACKALSFLLINRIQSKDQCLLLACSFDDPFLALPDFGSIDGTIFQAKDA
ncbi:MAG TPA: hypothetical protein DDZ51_14775 [Planctomycetaceae bacterium]|nr:hypothetical protein [Planctomycetaceae bacterium]